MKMSYKFKLNPTKDQGELLSKWEGSTRWLWNEFLAQEHAEYKLNKKFIWKYDLKKQIPNLKILHPWLKDTPAHALQNVAFGMHNALKRSTGTNKDLGFPKFKRKYKEAGSITINQVGTHIKVFDKYIDLPKIGEVKWKMHRPLHRNSKIKLIQITQKLNNWYISVCFEIPDVPKIQNIQNERTIGVDLGIRSFATFDTGIKIKSQDFLKKKLVKLSRYQKRQARMKNGSKNKTKQNNKLAKIHDKITNSRRDFLHKESIKLIKDYDVICVETLKVKELLEKKVLSREISDAGWAMFIGFLNYKSDLYGKHLVKIGQFEPSSKACSSCGNKQNMTLSCRTYICQNVLCNDYLRTKDRDINAAMNIKSWGIRDGLVAKSFNIHTAGIAEMTENIILDNACRDINHDTEPCDWHHEISLKQEAAPMEQ